LCNCTYLFLNIESASSPLVGFDGLNDNIIKSLTSLLSVEQEIESIAYTYGLWNEKWLKVQQEGKLDDIPHNIQIKVKVMYCCVRRSWKQSSSRKGQQCK
jgi:hypothetical protein